MFRSWRDVTPKGHCSKMMWVGQLRDASCDAGRDIPRDNWPMTEAGGWLGWFRFTAGMVEQGVCTQVAPVRKQSILPQGPWSMGGLQKGT